MFWMIIIILLVVILAGVGIWAWQTHLTHEIKELDATVAALDTGELTGMIRSIEQLRLSGESLKTFTKWQRTYQQLTEKNLTDLQTQLLDVEQANRQFRFSVVNSGMKAIDQLMLDTRKALGEVRTALTQLKASEAENRTRMLKLRDDYQEARKTILAKSFSFGEALNTLEQSLETIGEALKEVSVTNDSGDHEAAKSQLDAVNKQVRTLQDQVKTLPPLVNAVVNEFPAQLTEIETGHETLTQRHFVFTEDVPGGVQVIQAKLAKAQTQIAGLQLDALKANTDDVATSIDALYAVMEKELVAQKAVMSQHNSLAKFIAHATKQNNTLMRELNHLNESYTLNHNELQDAASLQNQINRLNEDFTRAQDAIQQNTAVYSVILDQFTETKNALHDIEAKQVAINTSVVGLRASEQKADDSATQFEMDLRDIKYEVSRHSLPGLPKTYLDFFRVVTGEVDDLNDDLNQTKIDMDEVAKNLIKIAEDIDQLKDQSRALVDAAGMTEQLLQYANRYKTNHEEVAKAAIQSKTQYSRYNYQAAADTIASALEKVEPGSYKKVENDYLNQRTDSLF
ncbi:septation ring formation regulator EzrA [Lacticaseibacillus mingshuiensis]|uniref:Septation ring formation regulator EzrA n=1 Tax=Lacticaseibacillus mingshuiensis TaxID=2799574 RepID=A0ABW4CLC4_9LACO|nr:septation ring formation regulator EzrA [Lacticaseibacillus mingshuiensis]